MTKREQLSELLAAQYNNIQNDDADSIGTDSFSSDNDHKISNNRNQQGLGQLNDTSTSQQKSKQVNKPIKIGHINEENIQTT